MYVVNPVSVHVGSFVTVAVTDTVSSTVCVGSALHVNTTVAVFLSSCNVNVALYSCPVAGKFLIAVSIASFAASISACVAPAPFANTASASVIAFCNLLYVSSI